ncbi:MULTISPECIES: VOC family protein [Paraburkholderia]|uniref:Biphenyl-2,3-diol 1,2-dioxygenase n=1 Tax=Paraburkholderia podalyriae TaxID=1938811 RepID=A0ABR7Q2D0_9BURK|nr:VOC family protein [Paraburkholderia podalyriae]MBC8752710.1 biphenyl-2,3-diol 1,2-dioxygenase [Paraburkholderia podalyriae]
MNTEITIRPKLQHLGLVTRNLDAMTEWYRQVLGMTINHRFGNDGGAQGGPPFRAAFVSNDEVHHRIVFFELPGHAPDASRRAGMQHVAFEYRTLDELLGTYVRLKGLGIMPLFAAGEGFQTVFNYADPDGNAVELNVNNYGNDWTATEHMRNPPQGHERRSLVDPDKLVAARLAGVMPEQIHERIMAGEFVQERAHGGHHVSHP